MKRFHPRASECGRRGLTTGALPVSRVLCADSEEDPSEHRPEGHVALTSGQLPVGAVGRLAGTPERPAWPRPTAMLPHVRCQEGSPLLALSVWFLYHVDFPTREPSTLRFHLILLPRGGAERGWPPRLHQPRARGQRCIRSAQEMCSRCLLCAGPWAEGGGDSVTEGSLPPDWLLTSNLE